MIHDAVVVGAGLSGLVCARRLADAGANVIVLEARDRVGGRLHTGMVGGAIVDLGGQWMTGGQTRLAALAGELGVVATIHERHGRALLDEPAASWPTRAGAAFTQWRAMRRIDKLAPERDRSLEDWLATIGNPIARDRIRLHAELVFACEPAELSLLFYLATLRATGGFGAPVAESRFVGGAQSLALRLAERLGDRIVLAHPIDAIETADTADTVCLRGPNGSREARRAVLAIPPALAAKLLPATSARLYTAGSVVKIFAAYERAFWRDAGWSGEQYRPHGTVRATVELAGDPPVLLGFVVGAEAARWASRDPDERKTDVLATFARLGDATPLDYLEVDWGADPWSAGCVAGVPPGAFAQAQTWREPQGRLHVAGTETAREWPGYMEGAIEAGERAAAEVLAALS